MNDIVADATAHRIIPVVEIADPEHAVALAEALMAGGLPVAEITLRTPRALEAIEKIATALPDFLVGAGSILHHTQVAQCRAAGAAFGVSPGTTPGVCEAAAAQHLPIIPGVATASELMTALDLGYTFVKFFPAEQLGGTRAIHSLAAPFTAAHVRLVPTGGITADNLPDYLSEPSVAAVGGSWIASRAAIGNRDFRGIRDRAAAAIAAAATL